MNVNLKIKFNLVEMKKYLFFASAALAMVSCTNELETIDVAEKVSNGITFAVEENIESRAQWDYVEGGLGMFWYAEKDKMDFYGKNVKAGSKNIANAWNTTAGKLIYKATRSEGKGYFTSTDANVFSPVKNTEETAWLAPTFAYVWPTGTIVTADTNGKLVATLPALNSQNQDKVNGSSTLINVFMCGTKTVDTASFDEDYTSGSDMLVDIQLKRTMPLLGFYVKGYDETTFGKLMSVTLTSEGKLNEDGTFAMVTPEGESTPQRVKSNLNYGTNATWNIETGAYTAGTDNTSNSVAVTLNSDSGLKWGNGKDYTVFMTVAPVNRSSWTYGEKMTVSYKFEQITINREITLKQTWESGHHYYANVLSGADGYDLTSEPYLVFNNKTLQLNPTFTGNLSDIITEGAINKYDVDFNTITRIVSHVALSDTDFAYIGENASALTSLVLKENTSIPAFESAATNALTYLEAPKVTTIAQGAFEGEEGMNVALTHCLLGSYKYNDAIVANQLLTDALVEVDLSAVESIAPEFPAVGISLQGFASLETVTVMDGVKLGTKAFYDCEKLATIKYANGVAGAVDLVGTYVFGGSSYDLAADPKTTNAPKLTSIKVKGTEIPQGSFAGAIKLATILGADGNAIVPTSVGDNAFEATPITTIDLSAATEIGDEAFMNCTALVGDLYEASGVYALEVSKVETVAEGLFNGCKALKYVSFPNATKVNDDFLKGTACNEIKFVKEIEAVLTSATDVLSNETFGTTTNTVLFINGGQEGISGTTLTLGETPFTFKNIK